MQGSELITIEPRQEEPNPQQGMSSGQAVLFEQYALFRRVWGWVIGAATFVTIGVAYLFFFVIPVQYAGISRAVPPNKQGTPLDNVIGGVASTLKDFGLSKLVGKSGSESGYSRSVILTSNRLYDSLIRTYDLFKVYDIPRDRYDLAYNEIRSNMVVAVEEEGPISVTVYDEDPKQAAAMANDVIRFANSIARDMNRRETEPISRYMEEQLKHKHAEQAAIEVELSAFLKKNKLFDPEAQAPSISTGLIEAEASVSVQRQLAEYFRSYLGADDPQTLRAESLLKQAQGELTRMQQGKGSGPATDNLPSTAVEYVRLKSSYEANLKYLALVEPMYQQSKFDEMRDIPILIPFDMSRVPVLKARPKRSVILASAFVGSLLIAYLAIAIISYWRNFKRRFKEYSGGGVTVSRSTPSDRGA